MAHFLADVRQFMISSRRMETIPQDYLQALHTHQLSLRSLLPHLRPPIAPTKTQFTLEKLATDSSEQQDYRPINSLFAEANHTQSYIPKHFPHLPDRHTYQATPDFPQREHDPRTLRERAAEEGRLGEQALRKLMTAETAALSSSSKKKKNDKKPLSLREQRHQLWLETMSAVAEEQQKESRGSGDMMEVDKEKEGERSEVSSSLLPEHLSMAVNSEKKYWRKPARA